MMPIQEGKMLSHNVLAWLILLCQFLACLQYMHTQLHGHTALLSRLESLLTRVIILFLGNNPTVAYIFEENLHPSVVIIAFTSWFQHTNKNCATVQVNCNPEAHFTDRHQCLSAQFGKQLSLCQCPKLQTRLQDGVQTQH